MQDDNVIEFRPVNYFLERARYYMERPDAFVLEPDAASRVLLKALNHAPEELKPRIMALLGGFAGEAAAGPFFHLMTDPRQTDETRHAAAIELSLLCGRLADPAPIMERLGKQSRDPDPFSRANALIAMAWSANAEAVLHLVNGLYDPDPEVRQAAVHGLVNLGDDRILPLLLDRLHHGPTDQQRAILCNLWRFSKQRRQISAVYRKCLADPDPDLRWEALVAMDLAEPAGERPSKKKQAWTADFVGSLRDPDHRIRLFAIRRLAKASTGELVPHRPEIAPLEDDPEPAIRREARHLLSRLTK